MFRILMYLSHEWLLFGEVILILSVLTAVYGIANAAVKNDFKRMLAFCTIENIGIIGIGLGLGLIGLGNGNQAIALLGFSGALLHTLNHSLFKSLLFFGAGSVYQQTHTRNMERLGGLMKKMPVTAVLFLIGALAIGGLPPFNGFVSEFIIYSGLFNGLLNFQSISQAILFVLSIVGLVLVGGMSLLTFTKTFGVIFLGTPREYLHHEAKEASFIMILPQLLIVTAMLSIAIFPQIFFSLANKIVLSTFAVKYSDPVVFLTPVAENIASIGKISMIFILLLLSVFGIRWLITRKRDSIFYQTWGCGYISPVMKAQYTSRSFTRSFGLLFGFLVKGKKRNEKIPKLQIYPDQQIFSTRYFDLLEKYLVFPLAKRITFTLNYFQFIQNGQIQYYVLYGLFFIILIFLGTAFNLIH
jgi:NADH:ubiquinone oxidoreductase subunit 5 (subunit L)/multisubunit Na+/H+ antiporter MnhA subunit